MPDAGAPLLPKGLSETCETQVWRPDGRRPIITKGSERDLRDAGMDVFREYLAHYGKFQWHSIHKKRNTYIAIHNCNNMKTIISCKVITLCFSSHLRGVEACDAERQEPPDRHDPALLPHRCIAATWSELIHYCYYMCSMFVLLYADDATLAMGSEEKLC